MKINCLYNSQYNFAISFYFKRVLFFIGFLATPFFGFNQSTVVVTATDAIATEGTPVTDTGVFEIDLGSTNNTGGNVTVDYIFSGTATAGADYTDLGGSIIISNGFRKVQLTVVPVDDTLFEGNEEVKIRLISSSNALFQVVGNSSSNASITLVDNDGCSAGPTAPPLQSTFQTQYCSGIEVDLSSSITKLAPPGTTLRWSTSSNPNPNTSSSFLQSSIITTGGNYYGFYYGNRPNGNACISPVVSLPTITFDMPPSLGSPSNNNQVCNQFFFGSVLDLDNTLTGETSGGVWNLIEAPSGETTVIGSGNNVNYNGQPTGIYIYTYRPNYAGAPNCPPLEAEVTVFVSECSLTCTAGNTSPVLNTNVPTIFCIDEGSTLSQDLSLYTNSTAPNGTKLVWSRSNDYTRADVYLNNTIVSQQGTFYAFFLDEANNCASPVLSVSIIIKKKPEILTFTQNALCTEGIMTLNATATDGSVINWYSSTSSVTPLLENSSSFTTPNLTTTTTFYVEASLEGCISDRQAVVATINNQPVVQAVATPINACDITDGDYPTVINLNTGLTQSVSGTWVKTSDPSNSLVISSTNTVNFENAPVGNYTFTFTTNTAVAPCINRSVTITVTVNKCLKDSDNDGLSDDDEISIGTNPNNQDSDNDGILDAVEVGDDILNPIDTDSDGIIDALDSNVLDSDMDGVVDQLDPANTNPCIPDNTVGMCDTDGDGISDGDEMANGTDHLDPCDPNLTPDCAPDPIDLEIRKTVDILRPEVDDIIEFTITLTNLSPDRVIAISIDEIITAPRGFEYISHTVTAGSYNPTTGKWDIQEIQGNEINVLKIKVLVLDNGDYINTAEVKTTFPRDNMVNNNKAAITVIVVKRSNDECGFLFNQFSPNSDGTNDYLIINCIENYPNNRLEIFDRYGNQVYIASKYENTWDGSGKNGDLPKGTYYYILDLGNGSPIKKGWIQIIR